MKQRESYVEQYELQLNALHTCADEIIDNATDSVERASLMLVHFRELVTFYLKVIDRLKKLYECELPAKVRRQVVEIEREARRVKLAAELPHSLARGTVNFELSIEEALEDER